MAQETVDKHLITQFSDQVHVQAQQMKARLRPHVQVGKMTGDDWAFDTMGQVEAREIFGRIQKVEFDSIDHNRRKITKRRFAITLPIDARDIRGALLNHKQKYAEAVAKGMERQFDRIVIEKQFADVLTGRNFGTTITYATEGLPTVDATAGLTYEKLLEIMRQFIDNEVGNDMPEMFVLGISGDEHEALMKETELTSGDFTRQFAVEKGELVRAAGFIVIKYGASVNNPLLPVAAAVRDNFAMSTRSMFVGMSAEINIKVENRPDFYEVEQVQAIFELGSVRTEGNLIQRVQTTE